MRGKSHGYSEKTSFSIFFLKQEVEHKQKEDRKSKVKVKVKSKTKQYIMGSKD